MAKTRKAVAVTAPISKGTEDVSDSFQVNDKKAGEMLTCTPNSAAAMTHLSRGGGHFTMKAESGKRGGKAIRALQRAARYSQMEPHRGMTDVILNRFQVERAQAEAEALLKPAGELVAGGGEVAHVDTESEVPQVVFADTIREPNMIGVDASEQRMEAAADAGVLEAALDAAESARAGNSLEKMLCHQMAAAHHAAMKLMARGTDSRLPPAEMARLTNAAARMMDTYQTAFLTLLKIRTGGKQMVVVQHVQVSDGGQALITGSMKAGGLKPGEVTGNEQ